MKIPLWKKWLSHLTPLTIEETASEHNPELTVALSRGRLQLLSGDAIYSWDDLYQNFLIAFDHLKIDEEPFEDVLVLGLGLGSIPYMLETVFHRNYYYTAVEWDETISELAAKYTLSRLKSSIDVITGDAEIFVQVTEEQYDMVIIDIFEDANMPNFLFQDFFINRINSLLNLNGFILFNTMVIDKKQEERNRIYQAKFNGNYSLRMYPKVETHNELFTIKKLS